MEMSGDSATFFEVMTVPDFGIYNCLRLGVFKVMAVSDFGIYNCLRLGWTIQILFMYMHRLSSHNIVN